MEIAILIFDGLTALDAIGPYEVLAQVPGVDVKFVGPTAGPQRTEDDFLTVVADFSIDQVTEPAIVVVPGGFGTRRLMRDEAVLDWVRKVHETSRWTTSVCTGSLILAAAGILDGLRATSHWMYLDMLTPFGAEPTGERVVEQGKVITAAGVSSGIDMALRLVELEFGPEIAQMVQLSIEYDPQPPFNAGSPDKAPPEIVEAVRIFAAQQQANTPT